MGRQLINSVLPTEAESCCNYSRVWMLSPNNLHHPPQVFSIARGIEERCYQLITATAPWVVACNPITTCGQPDGNSLYVDALSRACEAMASSIPRMSARAH